MWCILFYAIVWSLWECRNENIFKGAASNFDKVLDSIKFRVALWFKFFGCGSEVDLSLLVLDVRERCVDK